MEPLSNLPYCLTGPHRRPAGKMVLRPLDSRDGFKGTCSYLAEALGGRWSHQAGGYVMAPGSAAALELLHAAGFTGSMLIFRGGGPATFRRVGVHECLTRAEALKLARGA